MILKILLMPTFLFAINSNEPLYKYHYEHIGIMCFIVTFFLILIFIYSMIKLEDKKNELDKLITIEKNKINYSETSSRSENGESIEDKLQ